MYDSTILPQILSAAGYITEAVSKKSTGWCSGFFLCARVQLHRFNLACFFYYSANSAVASSVSNPVVGSTEHLLYASDLAHQAEFYPTEEARCRGLGQEQSSAGPSLSPYQHPQTSSPTKRQWTRMGNSWASQRWMAWMRVFSVPASIYKPAVVPGKFEYRWLMLNLWVRFESICWAWRQTLCITSQKSNRN